jgi:hypothetical protein
MPRKPKKLEEVSHGPFKATIRFDIEAGEFSCDYGGDAVVSRDLKIVRKWATDRLRRLAVLEWKPIMSVNFDAEDDRVNNLVNCSNVRCYIERFYVAWDGKKWVQCPWVVMPPGTYMCSGPNVSEMEQDKHPMDPPTLMQQRIAYSKDCCWTDSNPVIKFPVIGSGVGSSVYYVPYTEERWRTLVSIIEKIRELRARIHGLLSTGTGWKQLAAIAGVKLLEDKSNETKS